MSEKDYQILVDNIRTFNPKTLLINLFGEFIDNQQKLTEAQQELESASFMKKGKIKKAVEDLEKILKTSEEKLVKNLAEEFTKLFHEMSDKLKEIAIIAPENVSGIRSISSPAGFKIPEIVKFCKQTFSEYEKLLGKLRTDTFTALEENRDLLEHYRKYVDVPLEEVNSTSKITRESIDLMNLPALLKEKDKLNSEKSFLEKKRDDVERGLRVDLINELSVLEKDSQTALSLGLEISRDVLENFASVRSQIGTASSLNQLFSAENLFKRSKTDFLSSLRSEISKVRQDVETQVGRLATVSKETKNFPEPPESNLSVQTSLELIQQIETIRAYEKKVLLAMKRLVDINEFHASLRAVEAKNINIPRSLREDAFETAKNIHSSESIKECTDLLISYFNISSSLTEIIREKLFEIVNNDALKSIQSFIPPAPVINLESINPKILIRQFDEIDIWSKSVSGYLQGMTTEINNVIDQLTKAERHIPIRDDFKKDLSNVMNKVMGEKDVTILIQLRKSLNEIQDTIYNYLFKAVNEELHSTLISKLSMIPGITNPISFELRNDLTQIQALVAKLDEIADWKKKVTVFLKDTTAKLLDQSKIMAETSQIFEVRLEQDYYNKINETKESLKKHIRLEELFDDYQNLEKIREELKDVLRNRIKTLVDLISQLGMDLVSDIGVSLDGDVPILKESLEKIYKWMENKKSTLQKEIEKSKSSLRLFQSKVESGQLTYKVSQDFLSQIADKSRPSVAKNDVTELASELNTLSQIAYKTTDFLGDNIRKDVKNFREQIIKARELRSSFIIADPSIPEANPGQIDRAVKSLEMLDEWKNRTQEQIIEGLKILKFPQLRIETEFDLSNAKQLCVEDIQRLPSNQAIERYIEFLNEMEQMRVKIISSNQELKKKISSVTERSETLFNQRIEDYTDSRIIEGIDYSYSEVFQEWWNLTSHLQWQKEVLLTFIQNDIGYKLSVLQELAAPHDQYFEPTVSFLFEKSQGSKDKDIEDIFNDFKTIQDKTFDIIEEDYRRFLQAGILPSIRVSLPRIMEVVKLPPRVAEIERNIEKAITNQKEFFAIVGSANQLMSSYNEIVSELKSIAKDQSIQLIKEIDKLKTVGFDLTTNIPKEMHAFANLDETGITLDGEKRQPTIKDTTDCFVAIDNIKTNKEVCGKIRVTSISYRNQMKEAIGVIASEYGFNVEQQVPIIRTYLSGDFERDISRNNLLTLIELFVNIGQIRNDLIQLMKDLELQQQNKFEKQLESKYTYYQVIKEIFDNNKNIMQSVFPMATFLSRRDTFFKTDNLEEMTSILPEIRKGRGSWDETIEILSRYHRALRMFIVPFEKSTSEDENVRQYEEIKKKISSTYKSSTGTQIRIYFTAAVKQFIEVNTNMKLPVEVKDEI
jgi:hypothetical protein